jgi:hypothetical protein
MRRAARAGPGGDQWSSKPKESIGKTTVTKLEGSGVVTRGVRPRSTRTSRLGVSLKTGWDGEGEW